MQNKIELSNYEKQAIKFLNDTGTELKADRTGFGKYFDDDKEARDIYTVTISRKDKKPFVFTFGQSIKDSGTLKADYLTSREFERSGRMNPCKPEHYDRKRKTPSAYDILTCLQKYPVGTFDDFCSDFGYNTDSRKSEKIYIEVLREYGELCRLFTPAELEKMAEIQ